MNACEANRNVSDLFCVPKFAVRVKECPIFQI
jgi:hypothetical protein